MLFRITKSISSLIEIESNYNSVVKKTSELYKACEDPLKEEKHLKSYLDQLHERLIHFDALESVYHKFNNPSLSLEDEIFLPLVMKLDEGIEFLSKNQVNSDPQNYYLKFKQMQSRALMLMRNYIIKSIKETLNKETLSVSMIESLKKTSFDENLIQNDSVNEKVANNEIDNLIISNNIQLKLIAPKLRPLCIEVEKKATKREYASYLTDILSVYFQNRKNILLPRLNYQIKNLLESDDIFKILRQGCYYFIKICLEENELSNLFFTQSFKNLRMLLEGLFVYFYDYLRPKILRTQELEILCSLLNIIESEIVQEWFEKRSLELIALKPMVYRMIEDIKDRLIFLSDIYLRDKISDFQPSSIDIDYLSKLLEATKKKMSLPEVLDGSFTNETLKNSMNFKNYVEYNAWYPTLERTIELLTMLYVSLDSQTFNSIAQETIISCTQTLWNASKLIENSLDKTNGYLFLIRSITILKQHITSFEINFFVQERTLDFSHTRDLLRRLLAGELSLSSVFSLSSNNSIFAILKLASPIVNYSETDLRKTFETLLTQTIEALIFTITQLCIGKLLDFITTSMTFLNKNKITIEPYDDQKPVPSLATQYFARPDLLLSMFSETKSNFDKNMHISLCLLNLYLYDDAPTKKLIYNSIKLPVLDALDKFEEIIQKEYTDEEVKGLVSFSSVEASSFMEQIFNSLISSTISLLEKT